MKYGINRIGYHKLEKCPNCGWESYRSELVKDCVSDNDADEKDKPIDEHWFCPNCKTVIIE